MEIEEKVLNAVMLKTLEPTNKEDLFIVWSCYILGNRKFLIGVNNTNRYFEVTYNDISKEWYIDEYDKLNNSYITDNCLTEYTKTNTNN